MGVKVFVIPLILIALWVLPKLTGWVIEGLEIAWDALKR
jgi:hypothetical protein